MFYTGLMTPTMPCDEYDQLVNQDVNRRSQNEVSQDNNVRASVVSGSVQADPEPDDDSQEGDLPLFRGAD